MDSTFKLFHLDRAIGVFSIDEIAQNLKDNSYWVNAVDEGGNTPLHIAARKKEIGFVRAMLPHYGHANAFDSHGNTLLHVFIDRCMASAEAAKPRNPVRALMSRSSAVFSRKHRIIRSLLAKGADVNFKNKQGVTPAQLAAKHGRVDVLRIFESRKKDLAVEAGENLLHLVCKNEKSALKDTPTELKAMGYLIGQGCDVNATDADGYSPVHYALQTRSQETVKKLLQLGFDLPRWSKKVPSSLLLEASAKSNPSVIGFLIEQGANVNVKDTSGTTPLHLAASRQRHQQYESMELLLKSGAHIDAVDSAGDLPLDCALRHRNVEALECLMEFGLDVVRTASFRKLSFERVMDRWYVEKFALKHFAQLRAVGLPVDARYEAHLNRSEWQVYRRICLEEVKEMKLCMVDDRMSLYDLLHAKTKHCRYTHLPKLLRNLKSSFPIYYGIIRIRIHEIERKSLIRPATVAWYELTGIHLPYICVENVLSHLDSCCLRTMIRSSEDKIVYNSVLLQAKWLEES